MGKFQKFLYLLFKSFLSYIFPILHLLNQSFTNQVFFFFFAQALPALPHNSSSVSELSSTESFQWSPQLPQQRFQLVPCMCIIHEFIIHHVLNKVLGFPSPLLKEEILS